MTGVQTCALPIYILAVGSDVRVVVDEPVFQVLNQVRGPVQHLKDKLIDHNAYIRTNGEDMPDILNWTWKA